MERTWDFEKDRVNIRKRGIDFPTALLVFNDLDNDMRVDLYP